MGDSIEVLVDGGLDDEGRGTGHTPDGSPVRLPGVLEGERVRARVVHTSGRGVVFATPEQILQPAPGRRPVECPHFLTCGGCDFLHASLEVQHTLKRAQIAGALGVEVSALDPVVASPRPVGYRALAKLVVGPDGRLGSYRPRSHEIADMSGCLVHAPEVEAVVAEARQILDRAPGTLLRYLIVRGALAEGRAVVTLVARSKRARGVPALAERLAARADVSRVVLHVNDSEGDALLGDGPEITLHDEGAPVERIGPVAQSLESGAFAQINPAAAALLYARVVDLADPGGRRIADLYCGSGGIALSLAHAGAARIDGIEAHPAAVEAATASAAAMDLADIAHFRAAAVETALPALDPVDAIVLNPPRKGASRDVLEAIAARRPVRLVYVSCNPKSLARDLEALRSLATVEVHSITPVDLFPQTRHVEAVVAADLS